MSVLCWHYILSSNIFIVFQFSTIRWQGLQDTSQSSFKMALRGFSKIRCHSPTQPQHELELNLIMGSQDPTHHPGTFEELTGNLGS